MEKKLTIKFLEFLEPITEANPIEKVINAFMVDNFDKPPASTSNDNDAGIIFLKRLTAKKLINVIDNPYDQISLGWEYTSGEDICKRWWDSTTEPTKAILTEDGLEYLHNYRVNEILLETNISSRDTNASIKDTNESVRKNITAQIILGIVSVLAIVITAIIAVMAYNKGDSENLILIRKAMQRQDSILQSIQLSQKGIDTSLRIMAKKTSQKKN
jgi:hypothetical protein